VGKADPAVCDASEVEMTAKTLYKALCKLGHDDEPEEDDDDDDDDERSSMEI
jgi:hypothetical protein